VEQTFKQGVASSISELISFDNHSQSAKSLKFLREKVIQLMKTDDFEIAAELTKEIIKANESEAESE
jgi:hypothetical protein